MAGLPVAVVKPLFSGLFTKTFASSKYEDVSTALADAIWVLVGQRKDYENKVETHFLKAPSKTYLLWAKRVQETEEKAKVLLLKRVRKRKIDLLKRLALMEEMQTLGEKIDRLKEEGDQLEHNLFVDEIPDIKKFDTLRKPLEQTLVLLKKDKVYKIGIYGPIGIGKTTIMRNLNKHEEVATLFDIVVWVTVSTKWSMQQDLCRALNLGLKDNNDDEEVKRTISRALYGKKYLLLLDAVKEPSDLEQLGITNNKNGSKVVLTTRLRHVCSLTVDRMVRVSYLSPDEAWKMFQDVIKQPKLIKDSIVGPLAWRVCRECDGLPLLVKEVASAFRSDDSEYHWSDGLNSWRKWRKEERQGIQKVYNLFKSCYDELDDGFQTRCFLYVALYPEDSHIYYHHLLECWIAEGLLGELYDAIDERSLEFAQEVLGRLKDVSLLDIGK